MGPILIAIIIVVCFAGISNYSSKLEKRNEEKAPDIMPPLQLNRINTTQRTSTNATTTAHPVQTETKAPAHATATSEPINSNAERVAELRKIIGSLEEGVMRFENMIRSELVEWFSRAKGDNGKFCKRVEDTCNSMADFLNELACANLELAQKSNGQFAENDKVDKCTERVKVIGEWLTADGGLKERLKIPLNIMMDVQHVGKVNERTWEISCRESELGIHMFEAVEKSLNDANDLNWLDQLSSKTMILYFWLIAINENTTVTQLAKACMLCLRVCKYTHPEMIIAVEYWVKQRSSAAVEMDEFFALLSNECTDTEMIEELKERLKVQPEYFDRVDMFYILGCGEAWLGNETSAGLWFKVWEDNRKGKKDDEAKAEQETADSPQESSTVEQAPEAPKNDKNSPIPDEVDNLAAQLKEKIAEANSTIYAVPEKLQSLDNELQNHMVQFFNGKGDYGELCVRLENTAKQMQAVIDEAKEVVNGLEWILGSEKLENSRNALKKWEVQYVGKAKGKLESCKEFAARLTN